MKVTRKVRGDRQAMEGVSDLFHQAGETDDVGPINDASQILATLSEQEYDAMSQLAEI